MLQNKIFCLGSGTASEMSCFKEGLSSIKQSLDGDILSSAGEDGCCSCNRMKSSAMISSRNQNTEATCVKEEVLKCANLSL